MVKMVNYRIKEKVFYRAFKREHGAKQENNFEHGCLIKASESAII